jgi:peptide/nickel transport system substrate-binding protein
MAFGPLTSLDPQGEYSSSSWELLHCCLLRTLLAYDGLPGPTASIPKPDLATGPPEVSTDGLTWTFHLRPGLRYAPPLQDVPITAPDVVRAVLRLRSPEFGAPPYWMFFGAIDGWDAYFEGDADSIEGLSTPDDSTLVVRTTVPDNRLTYLFAMTSTAPIPPLPASDDPEGAATGHRLTGFGDGSGYGRFLVASGPYMLEGAERLDLRQPPEQQEPIAGLDPWLFDDFEVTHQGSIALVRNPSWDPATDHLRAALADRIELVGGDVPALEAQVSDGDLAMVFDADPTDAFAALIQRQDPERIQFVDANLITTARFNVASVPFDDLAVRRAVSLALDRGAITALVGGGIGDVITNAATIDHLAPDPMLGGLLSSWSPYPSPGGAPDLDGAREAMRGSPYAVGDRCGDPACRDVLVVIRREFAPAVPALERSLRAIGIIADVEAYSDIYGRGGCFGEPQVPDLCIGDTWKSDFPSPSQFLAEQFLSDGGDNTTGVGASAAALERSAASATTVPNVDVDVRRCFAQVGDEATSCWARLDQYLTTELVSIVPISTSQTVRVAPLGVTLTWNASMAEPALDRIVPPPPPTG